jgi:hypothetical protein
MAKTVVGSWNKFEPGNLENCNELMLCADFSVNRAEVVAVFGENQVVRAELEDMCILRSRTADYIWYGDDYIDRYFGIS